MWRNYSALYRYVIRYRQLTSSMLSAIVNWFTVRYPLLLTACKNKTLIPNPIAREIWAHNSFWVERKSNLKFEIWSQFDSEIIILGVHPLVHPTFSEGNIGSTQSSDPANERSCLSHLKNHFKNIGCGGAHGLNLAPNSDTDIIILLYM